jgi:uncharacterized membrane protein SirB2
MFADYTLLKTVHVTCAAVSGTGFVVRLGLRLAGSPWASARVVRVVPHVIDTLLLASAVAMALELGRGPWQAGWLPAKLVALLLYIGLGMVALRPGRSRAVRALAGAGAIAVFAYIVTVALTKSPLGPLAS